MAVLLTVTIETVREGLKSAREGPGESPQLTSPGCADSADFSWQQYVTVLGALLSLGSRGFIRGRPRGRGSP